MPYDNSRLFPIFSFPLSPFHARKVTIMHFYLFPSLPLPPHFTCLPTIGRSPKTRRETRPP